MLCEATISRLRLSRPSFQQFTKRWARAKILKRGQDPQMIEQMTERDPTMDKDRRQIYVWGFHECGALGNPAFVQQNEMDKTKNKNHGEKPKKIVKSPYMMRFFNHMKIRDVACGYGFTVIAAAPSGTDHVLFGSGVNADSQIGYHINERGKPLHTLIAFAPIQLPVTSKKVKVTKVACGRGHTVFLTDDNQLMSLGNNCYGQCGRSIVDGEIYKNSSKVNYIRGVDGTIRHIVCGQDHTLFLTEAGEVYGCGWGADGQTGLGHFDRIGIPEKLRGDIEGEKIVHLSSTADTCLACNDKGDVFGWGNSEYMQFNSITETTQLNRPRRLLISDVGKVVRVAAGGSMCAVVNDKGQVFVWGYGILGKGPQEDLLRRPSLIPEPLFGQNVYSPDVSVVSIFAGLRHFAAITNKGDLYTWGKNRDGSLGLGFEVDQLFPMRVRFIQ